MSADVALSVTVNGEVVPAGDASWYLKAPCGCYCGVTVFESQGEATTTPEAAMAALRETPAVRKQAEEQGFTIELGLRSQVVERMKPPCPHDPVWGVPPRPQVDGYKWASSRGSSVLHLAPAADVGSKDDPVPYGYATAYCGRSDSGWSEKWYLIDGKIECSRCIKRAAA